MSSSRYHLPIPPPRVPREPEANVDLDRGRHDPANNAELLDPSRRPRLDPPEISLSESQLELLAQKTGQQQPQHIKSAPRDPSVVVMGHPPPPSFHSRGHAPTTRTPNPVSRSDHASNASTTTSGAPLPGGGAQLLQQILKKAAAASASSGGAAAGGAPTSSSHRPGGGGTSSSAAAASLQGKRTLKKVLAQQLQRKKSASSASAQPQQKPTTEGTTSPTSSSGTSAASPKSASTTMLSSSSSSKSVPASATSSSVPPPKGGSTIPPPQPKPRRSPTAKAMKAVFGGGSFRHDAGGAAPAAATAAGDEAHTKGNSNYSIRERLKRARTPTKNVDPNDIGEPAAAPVAFPSTESPSKGSPTMTGLTARNSWTSRLKRGGGGGVADPSQHPPKPERSPLAPKSALKQGHGGPSKLKLTGSRSIDSAETRDRVKQIVSQHFAERHHPPHAGSGGGGGLGGGARANFAAPANGATRGARYDVPDDTATASDASASSSSPGIVPATTLGDEDGKEGVDREINGDESPEGYDKFFRLLQLEVQGSHTQLWSSFQAAFDASLAPTPPPLLEPSSKSTSKPRVKFDETSASILKKLHASLKARYPSAGKTQLVNDKAYAKQVRELPSLALSSSEETGTNVAGSSESVRSAGIGTAASSASDDPVLHTRSAEEEPSAGPPPTKSKKTSHKDDAPNLDAILSARSEESTTESAFVRSQQKLRTTDLSVSTDDPSNGDRTLVGSSSSASDLQLRHSRNLPSTSSVGGTGAAPEWSRLQLRKVDHLLASPKADSTVAPGSIVSDMSMFGKLLKNRLNTTESAEPSSSTTAPEEAQESPVDLGEEATMIRLASAPSFSLKPNETASILIGKHVVMIVSKTQRLSSSTVDEESQSDPSSARVLWKVPRKDVESLSLDMSILQVNLYCTESSKLPSQVLLFETSADCLQFANAFYGRGGAQSLSLSTSEPLAGPSDPCVPQDVDVTAFESSENSLVSLCDGDSSAQRLESLNDEEQAMLETYRRLRRTKGAQAALNETIFAEIVSDSKEALSDEAAKPNPIDTQDASASDSHERPNPPRYIHGDASSPVSLLSHSVLSDVEMVQVQTYRVLLNQHMDRNEVKRKMQNDRIDPKVVALVLNEEDASSAPAPTIVLTPDEEDIAKSFRTMLKLNFPIEVIRHRMTKEQVNDRIVEAVLGKSDSAMSDSTYVAALTDAEEEIAASYRKMLKLGFEKDVIRHRMKKESIDSRIVLAVLGDEQETSEPAERAPDPTNKPEKSNKKAASTLSFEEESVASSYRKMIKIQVPQQLVLSRMRQDGVSEKIISAVVGQSHASAKVPEEASADATGNNSKLVSLHWTPLSEKELDNSVWRVNSLLEDLDSQPERNDVSKLVSLFQKKTISGAKPDKVVDHATPSAGKARLLDITRANNVSISLKAFKEFSNKQLADAIRFLDPHRVLPSEKVLFLRGLLPTAAEIETIRSYHGSPDHLVPAELWFREIVSIQRIDAKVQVLQTIETFKSEVESLRDNFCLLSQVCHQVMESDKLVFLLGKVLKIGNIMNEGTRTGGAAGFKFDSLLRLTQTKSSDNKITVLDFLVSTLVDQGQRGALDVLSDFPECPTASRIVVGDLVAAAKDLKESLAKCDDELQLLRAGGASKTPRVAKRFGSDTGSSVDGAVLSAILARSKGSDGPPKPEVFTQRNQFLAAIKDRSSDHLPRTSLGGPDSPIVVDDLSIPVERNQAPQDDLRRGITRLEQFLIDAQAACDKMEAARSDALQACTGLARYCGESAGTGATSTLLSILATFATNLREALDRYDTKLHAELRKLRRKGDDSTSHLSDSASIDRTIDSTAESKKNGTSLVVLVNDMLKDANDRMKDDFIKGRVYPNPSSKLKAIYERERVPLSSSASPVAKPNRQSLIVSAIQEQDAEADHEEMLRARSRFGVTTTSRSHASTLHQNSNQSSCETKPSKSSSETEPSRHLGVKEARALFEGKAFSPISFASPADRRLHQPKSDAEKTDCRVECTSETNALVVEETSEDLNAHEEKVPVVESERSLYYVPLSEFSVSGSKEVNENESTGEGELDGDDIGGTKVESAEVTPTPGVGASPSVGAGTGHGSGLKLSEARKARSLLERMVGKSSPQPAVEVRKSLLSPSPTKKSNGSNDADAIDVSTPSSIDLSGSKERLLHKSESPAPGSKPAGPSAASPPPKLFPRPSILRSKEKEPRKSLMELAREKRGAHQQQIQPSPPPKVASPLLLFKKTPPSTKESPVMTLARERRRSGRRSEENGDLRVLSSMTVSESMSSESK